MKLYSLNRSQTIRRPINEVFRFFENPENLKKITPKKLGFLLLTPTPIEMKQGTLIDYTIKVHGIGMRWTTLITEFNPPYKFVDVQLKGPYSYWHHTHGFKTIENGTVMSDKVVYALPLRFIGRIVHALLVKRQLQKIFDYRAKIIKRHFSEKT